MPFASCEQMKKSIIAKLALIVKHCDVLEVDGDLCATGQNRVELVKILAVDCAEMVLKLSSQQEVHL